jgi:3-oxoacyl-[acyl-carrier protein] reductase
VNYCTNEKGANEVVAAIQSTQGDALAIRADIRDPEQVRQMFDAIRARYGGVDILVNNASAAPVRVGMKGFLEHTWNDYQTYIDTVLKGAYHCCRFALPGMIKRKAGRVINIGTASLNEINAHLNPYVTAKGGLLGMTRSLAEEFGKYNITVNGIAPGWVWSNENRPPKGDEGRIFRERSPLGIGVVTPHDVASAVLFLASNLSSGITGSYIPVCCGQVMPD